jgi:shikimate dehydrogenase
MSPPPTVGPDRYAVLGHPVAHSLSPRIHARFAEQAGEAIEYTAIDIAPGEFDRAARGFFASGARGANVTLPYKIEAFALAAHASERARLAGAANFLAVREGAIEADNTDGAGLVADLAGNLGVTLAGARILVLGAGGAARGVVAPLLASRPQRLVIANRTPERALELLERFRGLGPLEGCGLADIRGGFDLVVNATSASTRGESVELPAGLFAAGALAYDMAYGPAAAAFVARAREAGAARACDGLGMLVEQAAESFALWRGKRPETRALLAELRSSG